MSSIEGELDFLPLDLLGFMSVLYQYGLHISYLCRQNFFEQYQIITLLQLSLYVYVQYVCTWMQKRFEQCNECLESLPKSRCAHQPDISEFIQKLLNPFTLLFEFTYPCFFENQRPFQSFFFKCHNFTYVSYRTVSCKKNLNLLAGS